MDVVEALRRRRTCRAFLDTPVPEELLRAVLGEGLRAPSGGNTQPWHLYAACFRGAFGSFACFFKVSRLS